MTINKLVLSVVIACATILGCILLGILFEATKISVANMVGNFLQMYSVAIGILSGVWYYFTH